MCVKCGEEGRESGGWKTVVAGGMDGRERKHKRTTKKVQGKKFNMVDSWSRVGRVKIRNSRKAKVTLSSRLLEIQYPKLCSDLTFQKHRLIQLSFLYLSSLSALPHLFTFIFLTYSCHISSAPNLFRSITLLLYFPLLLCPVMYLFLMVTLWLSPH